MKLPFRSLAFAATLVLPFVANASPYICLGLGGSKHDLKAPGALQPGKNALATALFAGTVLSNDLVLEAGVTGISTWTAAYAGTSGEANYATSAIYGAVGKSLPLSERFRFIVKGGVAQWTTAVESSGYVGGTSLEGSTKETGFDLTFGVGLSLNLDPHSSFWAEFQRFQNVGEGVGFFDGATTVKLKGSDADVITGGIAYHF